MTKKKDLMGGAAPVGTQKDEGEETARFGAISEAEAIGMDHLQSFLDACVIEGGQRYGVGPNLRPNVLLNLLGRWNMRLMTGKHDEDLPRAQVDAYMREFIRRATDACLSMDDWHKNPANVWPLQSAAMKEMEAAGDMAVGLMSKSKGAFDA